MEEHLLLCLPLFINVKLLAYLRDLSVILNIPIFSIDYRLAPRAKHPYMLYDCIAGYYWVCQFLEFNGVTDYEIIIMGDSAGGNLALGVALWIEENIKKGGSNSKRPKALALNYPVFVLRQFSFTKSIYFCINDYILNYNGMKIGCEYYLNKGKSDCEKDAYLSPLYASDDIWRSMPYIYFNCGTDDPLIDDCFRFIEKKIKLGLKNIKFQCFKHLPHGLCTMKEWKAGRIFIKNMTDNVKYIIDNIDII